MKQADFIIIGAGLMGSSAALWLARAGKKVLLLEKKHHPGHASAVYAGGVRRLNRALRAFYNAACAAGAQAVTRCRVAGNSDENQ